MNYAKLDPIQQVERAQLIADAHRRENDRIAIGHYNKLPQWFYAELADHPNGYPLYCALQERYHAHLSNDKTTFCYTANDDKLIADRQTNGKIGRFLSTVYNRDVIADGHECRVLSEPTIASLSNLWRTVTDMTAATILRATGTDIAKLYQISPNSCMSSSPDEYATDGIHPCEVYGTDDIEMLYIKRGDRITARCLLNKLNNKVTRIYGDAGTMSPLLKNEGYTLNGSLYGCRILRLENDSNQIIMPYLDGNSEIFAVEGDSKHYIVGKGDSYVTDGCHTHGLGEEGTMCACCEHSVDEDTTVYIECEDVTVCDDCANEHYVYSEYHEGYISLENAVEVEGRGYWNCDSDEIVEHNGSYYLYDDLSEYELIELDGEIYEHSDCVYCEYSQEYVLEQDCTYIDSNEAWVLDEYVRDVNGTPYIVDSDELQAAIDDSVEEYKLELIESIG
tara:strand:- start:14606 stop:15952 length:1347 start_codon:yes stop_codon:yes gene_type:complete